MATDGPREMPGTRAFSMLAHEPLHPNRAFDTQLDYSRPPKEHPGTGPGSALTINTSLEGPATGIDVTDQEIRVIDARVLVVTVHVSVAAVIRYVILRSVRRQNEQRVHVQ